MTVELQTPVQFIKGVGPKLGDILRKRGVTVVNDLLEWYPRAYEDRRKAQSISQLQHDQIVSLQANIVSVRSMPLGSSNRKIYEVVVSDQSGKISCKYFRVPYRGYFERFEPYQKVRVNGKVTQYRGHLEFHHPDIYPVSENEAPEDTIIPLYTETEGLSPTKLRKVIANVLNHLDDLTPELETLPGWICQKYGMVTRKQALLSLHQPQVSESETLLQFRSAGQQRIIFEEFFWLELLLAARKKGFERERATPIRSSRYLCKQLIQSLGFQLTGGQSKTFEEIVCDLQKSHPMHRLVQGDVGSGKTIVAFLAACYAAEQKIQTAFMVPTEILAEQHFQNAKKWLAPLGLKIDLLIGSLKTTEKQKVYEQLQAGTTDICIGTHALIQDPVQFSNLGLIVIDEQHRFGVAQRQLLKAKGISPHFLVMTATPIPRTLAMTVYGDLDVSILRERPQGRQPIVTRKVFANKRDKVFHFVEQQLRNGRQAYVVYPLVEESEKLDLKNALQEYENIKARFPTYQVGLLHGRMKPNEKDQVMREFRDHHINILVATTVIEVGVDVANANIMVIEHAERFGLSQLHQLRGRVGRGSHKSYCILVLGFALSEESRKRAEIMESTSDGFLIAEQDLSLRGPGEFLGTRQSGLTGFKLANLVRDMELLQIARQAAFEILQRDPLLHQPDHQRLRTYLEQQGLKFVA